MHHCPNHHPNPKEMQKEQPTTNVVYERGNDEQERRGKVIHDDAIKTTIMGMYFPPSLKVNQQILLC